MVTLEEFTKIELKIGKIIEAARVEGSPKLVKLLVDIGESRQIIAGIGKRYEPATLIGRLIVIAANLQPRIILGLESQGMVLAADDQGPVLLTPDHEVQPGSLVR